MNVTVCTPEETRFFAEQLVTRLREVSWCADRAVVLGLSGPLGAGKTFLVQCVAEVLGVTDVVTSSSFVLRSDYTTTDTIFKQLIHIDAYRFERPDEVDTIGWDAVLASANTLVAVEWVDVIVGRIPVTMFSVAITFQGDRRVFTTDILPNHQ